MAFCKRSLLIGKGRTLQNTLVASSKVASSHPGIASSPSESRGQFSVRAFSSLLSRWQQRGAPAGKLSQVFALHHPVTAHLCQQNPEALSAQQVRHVYVEVIDNDLDGAIKVYKRKMNICKIELKIKEKQFHVKKSEHRKLAKHYKKLNRARRELNEKLRTAKHHMEKVREVRRLEKEEKRARAAAAAAAAQAKETQTTR